MAGAAVLIVFWRDVPGGVCVAVMVQPKSHRPGLQASALGVPATAVHVLSGVASREKTPHVAGDPAPLSERLAGL